MQLFLLALWLIKDNAANIELGFLEYPYGTPLESRITSNFRAVRFGKADGSIQDTDFTDSEARNARGLYSKLFTGTIVEHDEHSGYLVPEDFSRFGRLFYFIQTARAASDLGIRIANYVTCFESLFCTDSSEMAHKLSERVAFFLAETPSERPDIFKKMKSAYNIRSKAVHGDKVSGRVAEKAPSISVGCDTLLRGALTKILTTPGLPETVSGSNQPLEDYLTSLVLGSGAEDAN